ncbi:MAG: N-acetyltransferase [Thermoplasmata archaeon]|nr:MAG: N-acetyltransferase [Thermoplasmata archaeon]
MLEIRAETEEDRQAIFEVNELAFGRENEAYLVDALRESDDFIPELSLVAVKEGKVVGHILFSPIAIETELGFVRVLSLAPMAVLPEFQRQGIGTELVRQGLKECERFGHEVVVLIGHPEYYPRFGFSSARAKGLEAPFEVPDEAFMVLEIKEGALEGVSGMIKYPPTFDAAL